MDRNLFSARPKKGTMTDGAGQSFPGHTRCRVAIDTGTLGKVLMIILVYAARISEGKRFPLSLSLRSVGPHVLGDTTMCG